jgi:hypothetical protein
LLPLALRGFTTLGLVVHVDVASLKSFKAKVHGESQRGNQFNTTIQSQQGLKKKILSSPRSKPMIVCEFEDQAHHQPQQQGLHKTSMNEKYRSCS